MKRVYVAGAISSDNVLTVLENIRKGIRVSTEVLLIGHAVFSPFIDFNLFLQLRGPEKISDTTIKESSLKWLEVSDCVVLVDGWENSKGTKKELERAEALGLDIYYSIKDFYDEHGYEYRKEGMRF